jgi:hypothetical protein
VSQYIWSCCKETEIEKPDRKGDVINAAEEEDR